MKTAANRCKIKPIATGCKQQLKSHTAVKQCHPKLWAWSLDCTKTQDSSKVTWLFALANWKGYCRIPKCECLHIRTSQKLWLNHLQSTKNAAANKNYMPHVYVSYLDIIAKQLYKSTFIVPLPLTRALEIVNSIESTFKWWTVIYK